MAISTPRPRRGVITTMTATSICSCRARTTPQLQGLFGWTATNHASDALLDGKVDTVLTNSLVTATKAHTYAAAGSKLVKVYVYSSTGAQLAYFTQIITVN